MWYNLMMMLLVSEEEGGCKLVIFGKSLACNGTVRYEGGDGN